MTDTTTAPERVALHEADNAALRYYAGTILGLEIKNGWSNAKLIATIETAQPGVKDIPLPPAGPQAVDTSNSQAMDEQVPDAPAPELVRTGGDTSMPHFSTDPKVTLEILKTADPTRSKDVTVGVNGDVFRMQRGVPVTVPYRVYLALEDAIEKTSVETGETNPVTGMPMRDWQDVKSYPFTVHKKPSPEEVAAFHRRTDDAVVSTHRAKAA